LIIEMIRVERDSITTEQWCLAREVAEESNR
jgi:hypothetical protein